jgi:hypothetical protein
MKFRRNKEGLMGIGTILERTIKKLGLEAKLKESKIWEVWDDAVGAVVARNAQPESFRNRVLFVTVSSSAWMQQLQFLKEQIVEKLNQSLGKTIIKRISFRLGTIPSPSPLESEIKEESSRPQEIDPEDIERIEKTVSALKDDETKELVRNLMVREVKLKKFRPGRE